MRRLKKYPLVHGILNEGEYGINKNEMIDGPKRMLNHSPCPLKIRDL